MISAPCQDAGSVSLPDGGSLYYEIHGRRGDPPLLLLRPLGGSVALWGAFRDLLAEQLCVFSFDYSGTGRSHGVPARSSTRALARDGVHLLEQLGVPRAHVFGISLGGMAATWLSVCAPERVDKLCLASTPGCGLSLTRVGVRRGLSLASCFARPEPRVEMALVDCVLSARFRREHAATVHAIERTVCMQPAPRNSLLRLACAGAFHDAERALCGLRAPTLALAGAEDQLLGSVPVRKLARNISHAEFDEIEHAGHDLTLEQPVATALRVIRFLGA